MDETQVPRDNHRPDASIPSGLFSTCNRTYTRQNSADTVPPHHRRREADLPEVYRLIELAVKSLLAMFSLLNLRFT